MNAFGRFAWVAGVLAVVAGLGVAYGAYVLAGYSWDQVVSYESPYADYDRTFASTSPDDSLAAADTTQTPRVVMVLIDGLTLEASREHMTALNTVRGYGADMVAVTNQPSLSYPTWTTVVSGAPSDISGVTTNWFEGPVPVETIFDVLAGRRMVVSATDDFQELYDVERVATSYLEPWDDSRYLSSVLVDKALELTDETDPVLTFVYLPDADTIAHDHGPESAEYVDVVTRIDRDLSRLIDGMQDGRTMFVITADHGHVRGGGHGGWEPETTRVPAVFFGPGTRFEQDDMAQQDIAPTVTTFLGAGVPAHSTGLVRDDVVNVEPAAVDAAVASYRSFAREYIAALAIPDPPTIDDEASRGEIDAALDSAREIRASEGRNDRLGQAAIVAGAALLVLLLIAAASWRAFVASAAGVVAYYAIYNGLYFLVHGHEWSLAAFNTETYIESFFNLRMIEAAIAAVVAVAVAAAVYPLLRHEPKGPRGAYLGGWLSLGPATVLAIQATLAVQVAWFLWVYGAEVVWRLPDLKWGFKYDLDLIQATALGGAMLLAPVVAYLVGRYHPKVRAFARHAS